MIAGQAAMAVIIPSTMVKKLEEKMSKERIQDRRPPTYINLFLPQRPNQDSTPWDQPDSLHAATLPNAGRLSYENKT
jgi:hypothetical protein